MRVRFLGLCALVCLGCAEDSAAAGTLAPAPIHQTSIVGHAEQHLGHNIASVGDLDADGMDDFLINAALTRVPEAPLPNDFSLLLFYGRQSFPEALTSDDADAVLTGDLGNVLRYARPAGDLNGDGSADLIIGGQDWVQLVFGSRQRLRGTIDVAGIGTHWQAPPLPEHDSRIPEFRVAGTGDLNGDGMDDVIVSTQVFFETSRQLGPWDSFVVRGRSDPWPRGTFERTWTVASFARGGQPNQAQFGILPPPIPLGDVDGDGFADLGIMESHSSVRLHYGGPDRIAGVLGPTQADATLMVDLPNLLPLGDLDGDGRSDLMFSRLLADSSEAPDPSGAYGTATRWSGTVRLPEDFKLRLLDPQQPQLTSIHVVKAGADVDGDGHHDLLISYPAKSELYLVRGREQRAFGEIGSPAGELLLAGMQFGMTPAGLPDHDWVGTALDVRGDVDGDGIGDVLVGAPGVPEDLKSARRPGRVVLILGNYLRRL